MQTSVLTNTDPFDTLTVALGSAVSRWERLRLIGEYLLGQVLPFFGAPPPGAMSPVTIRYCVEVNEDGLCDTGEKSRLSGFTASTNRCGAAAGVTGCHIPSTGFPEQWENANWGWACDNHDRCYTNCTTPKAVCDINIGADIVSECIKAFPGRQNALKQVLCRAIAFFYAGAVTLCGENAWIHGQKAGCRCCFTCAPGLGACGTQCCQPDEVCCDGQCIRQQQCCTDTETLCAGQCIDSRWRQCCRNAAGEFICATHQTCCGNGTCCDAGSTCCEKDGVRSCIPYGDQNCDLQCHSCPSGHHCCLTPWGTSRGCCLPTEKCDLLLGCRPL